MNGVPIIFEEDEVDRIARSLPEARRILEQVGLPVVICPSFSCGRQNEGVMTEAEFDAAVVRGLDASATAEVLIEPASVAPNHGILEILGCADPVAFFGRDQACADAHE